MEPLRVALIGAGRRGQHIYIPILKALSPYVEVTAICDSVPELAKKGAEAFGVPAYSSLKHLVAEKPMEACIVVTPPESHHAISCYLSLHGIHHLVETPICSTLIQARQMVELAEQAGVYFRVGEQFFRDKIDVLARRVIADGLIGNVGRITNYHTHLGYHNNSRHQKFAGMVPSAVNAITHVMDVVPYVNTNRAYRTEAFHNISFHFANGLLITDIAGNIKGALGRYSRPGLVEIDGSEGAIVQQAPTHWQGQAEVRLVRPERLKKDAYSDSYPILFEFRAPDGRIVESADLTKRQSVIEGSFLAIKVKLPHGEIRIENELASLGVDTVYHSEVAESVRDFALLVRNGDPDTFPPEMAVASLLMSHAAKVSASRRGARVEIASEDYGHIDEEILESIRKQFNTDPLDIEAMIDISFPQP